MRAVIYSTLIVNGDKRPLLTLDWMTITAHCQYSFAKLQDVVPQAMASVSVQTIRRWFHRMWRWIDAYTTMEEDGKDLVALTYAVKSYKSHRRIPDKVADKI